MALSKKTKNKIVISVGALVLFFAYAWFPLSVQNIYNAPDELATAYTVQNIPLPMGVFDNPAPYSERLGGMVHPRSMVVSNSQLVPGMWLGLPWLLRVLSPLVHGSVETLELLVVLISMLAVFSWKAIVSKLLENTTMGWIAAFTLAVHPGWWYFTARGFHPNVLFISFLIFGVLAWYVASAHKPPKRESLWRDATLLIGGLSFGMAMFVRTNEAIWIVPLLLLVAWYQRKKPLKDHLLAVVGVAIPLLIMLNLNAAVYGAPFLTGYTVAGDPAPVAVSGPVEQVGFSDPLLARLFPFGIHESNIARNVTSFHIVFFALWTAFTVFGLLLLALQWNCLRVDQRVRYRRILVSAGLVSIYLLVVYGSWNINDNPDPSAVTIGTSYIRYWLPISLAMTVLVGYAMAQGVAHRHSQTMKQVIIGIWIVAFGYAGFAQTMFGQDEGLAFIRQNLVAFQSQRDQVLELTQSDDLIIVDRSDKILFPHRNVVYPLRSETTYAALPLMLDAVEEKSAELYYLGIALPDSDLVHLREVRLHPFMLEIEVVAEIDQLTLYRIVRL